MTDAIVVLLLLCRTPPFPVVMGQPAPIGYPVVWSWPAPPPIVLTPTIVVPTAPIAPQIEEAPKPKKDLPRPPLMPTEKTTDPPLPPFKPVVRDDKPFEVFAVQVGNTPRKGDAQRVKFFNHSDRDLVLLVDGSEVKLGVGEIVRLKLPTEFVWKEKGSEPNRQTIPAESLGLDIVIRR